MNEKMLQKEKVTTKNTVLNLVIILLLATIIVSAVIGLYAWAKYRSAIDGSAEAEVAKWHFELKGDVTENTENTSMALTRTDGYEHVEEGKLAPGTNGKLPITIDTKGTEVSLVYDLEVKITNYPKNMILKDSKGQKIIPVISGGTDESPRVATIAVSNYVPYNTADSNRLHDETITWNWPYETGIGASEISKNDEIDTQDAGKEISVSISVTGTQIMEKPGLADVVRVGEYVNYNASSGNGAEKSYTPDESITGTAEGINTFSSSDITKWKVMSIDKTTGTVELMAENPTENTIKLKGKTGYKNAEKVLNEVGKVYGYGEGAAGGRSITVEDVNKLENHTTTDDTTPRGPYKSGTFIMDDGTEVTATEGAPVTMSYTASNEAKSTNKYYSYTTTNFSGKSFWLASRCLGLDSGNGYFYVRYVNSGIVGRYDLFYSYGFENDHTMAVLPVVSLESNIQTSGQDESGAWNLIIEQN